MSAESTGGLVSGSMVLDRPYPMYVGLFILLVARNLRLSSLYDLKSNTAYPFENIN